jgi:hypothetical protein
MTDASSLPAALKTNDSDVIFMRHRILFFALAGSKGRLCLILRALCVLSLRTNCGEVSAIKSRKDRE